MRLYLNGVEVGSSPAPGPVDIAPALSVAVGGQPLGAGSNYFNGLIDDIRILSRPMSQFEIVAISSDDNLNPTAANDSYATLEDAGLTVSAALGVLANDSDPEDDVLEARLLSTVSFGTLALASDGSFTYTPDPEASGTDSFSYEAFDGRSPSNVASVTIDVMAIEDPPVSNPDSYSTDESTTLVIPAGAGVLANDFDPEGLALVALLQTDVQNGSLFLVADGSFSYTPDPGFSGDDSFTYIASDGAQSSALTPVTITVANPPTALPDSYGTDEDLDLVVTAALGVLNNDSDPQAVPLVAELVAGPGSGSVTLSADGSFSYSPAPDYSGPDSFTYRASNGSRYSNTTTVSIVVAELNDPPIADPDAYDVDLDSLLLVPAAAGVLANDLDPEAAVLSAILVADVLDGSLDLQSDGGFSYLPSPGFMGTDSFSYLADDGADVSSVVLVTITVGGSPLSVGLVAHWPMDAGSGPIADDVTDNGYDGTLLDPVWTTSTGDGSPAALAFDGLDDYVDVGPIDVPGQALSIAGWVNVDDFSTRDQRILSKALGTAEQDHLWMISTVRSSGNRLRARLKVAGSTQTIIASGTISSDQWVHFALTYNGADIRLYQDGMEVGSASQTGDLDVDPSISLALGNQTVGAGEKALAGLLDDVRIYERALSSAEVAMLADGVLPTGDTTPPAAPMEVVAVPLSTNTAEISWSDAIDDQAMGTYTVLRDGVAIASGLTLTQYVDSGLTSATPYDYSIVAIDAAGNSSAASITDSLLTLAPGAPTWFDPALAYRIPIDVDSNGTVRVGRYLESSLDLTAALASVGQTVALDPGSLRVTRSNASGQVLESNVAFQFDPADDFDAATNAVGELVVHMEGTAASADTRRYDLYFDVVGEAFTPSPMVDRLTVSSVVDEGQSALLIQAATASYYFHEQGASLSGLVDSDDNDWISYRVGGGSAGEFRGIPNLVYPESEFHPGATGGSTQIASQGPIRLRLRTTALSNAWQATWSFYDDHVSMIVEQTDHAYWFLYEGTPGGLLEEGNDSVTRSDGTKTLLGVNWDQDLVGEEWVYFSDPGTQRSLFLASHTDDSDNDTYRTMNGEMTVFGFGRSGTTTLLNGAPRTFSLGLIESIDFQVSARKIRSIVEDLGVTVGSIQELPPE